MADHKIAKVAKDSECREDQSPAKPRWRSGEGYAQESDPRSGCSPLNMRWQSSGLARLGDKGQERGCAQVLLDQTFGTPATLPIRLAYVSRQPPHALLGHPLPKNKHELFAQGLAKGLGIGAAYKAAGYKPSPAAATRLSKNVKLQERVAELQAPSAERATVTRQWMLERLKQNVERCVQATPVLDHEGNPTGKYKFAGNAANKALELLGKALGMFTKRGA